MSFFSYGKELIKGYRIVGEIISGQSATIYKAQDRVGNIFAVKLLSDYSSMVADKLTKKLGKPWEGERLASLDHPNIVRVFKYGVSDGRYYIVMEYLGGGNLSLLIRQPGDPLRGRRVQVLRQIGNAIAYIHSLGIIHRDIFTRNVLFTRDGTPKLIDFGVAMQKGDRLRDTGVRTGRPRYMAPEVIRYNRFTEQSDIFSFGVMMFDIFGGENPIRATDRTMAMRAQLETELPPIRKFNPQCSRDLERIIQKATARDTFERFQAMENLLRELGRLPPRDYEL